jgi:hypothetical protein
MFLEFVREYPRIIAAIFAALFAGPISAIPIKLVLSRGGPPPGIYISSAMLSSALWAAIVGRRVTDKALACTYFRAAMLGALATTLSILSVAIFINLEFRIQNVLLGLTSIQQSMQYLFAADLEESLGGGIFILIFFGWTLVPLGGLGGVILRWLRSVYEEDQTKLLYEKHERAKLHIGDE